MQSSSLEEASMHEWPSEMLEELSSVSFTVGLQAGRVRAPQCDCFVQPLAALICANQPVGASRVNQY